MMLFFCTIAQCSQQHKFCQRQQHDKIQTVAWSDATCAVARWQIQCRNSSGGTKVDSDAYFIRQLPLWPLHSNSHTAAATRQLRAADLRL